MVASVISVVVWEAHCTECGWSSPLMADTRLADEVADMHDLFCEAHPLEPPC